MQTPVSRTVLYALIGTLIAVLAVGVNSVVYPQRVAERINHQWCSLIGGLDDGYRKQPPATAAGKQFATEIHQLRLSLGCP